MNYEQLCAKRDSAQQTLYAQQSELDSIPNKILSFLNQIEKLEIRFSELPALIEKSEADFSYYFKKIVDTKVANDLDSQKSKIKARLAKLELRLKDFA